MARSQTSVITSGALAQLKHWLAQPCNAAEHELLLRDLPFWMESAELVTADGKPAVAFKIVARNGSISDSITLDPAGFAVLRVLTALGGTCMVDRDEKEGRQYVKVFADMKRSPGISLRRILSGASEGEAAVALKERLDLRACATGTQRRSTRDQRDQSDAIAEALGRFGTQVPESLGFRGSIRLYEVLLVQAFARLLEDEQANASDLTPA